jgi:imidazolonepropionase-like amidohydrolase
VQLGEKGNWKPGVFGILCDKKGPDMKKIVCFLFVVLFTINIGAQTYQFNNGNWWINNRFEHKTVYTQNGMFTFKKPLVIDSIIDLQNQYCVPPFGDAHTHNLDGTYGLKEMVQQYIKEGVFYVQVLGNHGKGAVAVRPALEKANLIDVTYANGLLTATYGHGFYPYEPIEMGFYSPLDQIKYADSVKKSRIDENNAYYFLDSVADVDAKWPLIMKYKPDHIKICLLDAADYTAKRKAEKVETYGLSPEVAAYVVKKAHTEDLRVFAHVETADDARLCAKIGVDALAHMPGYGWNGEGKSKNKYCLTVADAKLFKQAGMTVIPTMNIDHTTQYDTMGKATVYPERYEALLRYKKAALRALYRAKVPIALGADYYGKTVMPEIDSLIAGKIFSNKELIDIYCRQTPQHIFPKRKLGLIKEKYEASFLVLNESPVENIAAIKTGIVLRIKHGRLLKIKG